MTHANGFQPVGKELETICKKLNHRHVIAVTAD